MQVSTDTDWLRDNIGTNHGILISRYKMANDTDISQSWKMSNLLHGPLSPNQILPREKRVNRDMFGTSNLQNISYVVSCDE